MRDAIGAGLLLGIIHGLLQSAGAVPVTPNFTSGTVTSHTETTTTVTERIRQTDFQTGWAYTATGTNITTPGNFQHGATYTMQTPGESFQFSESYFGPGLTRETDIQRTTVIESTVDSVSVFTQ